MIKRLLLVITIGAAIIFIPYYLGSIVLFYFNVLIINKYDLFYWMFGFITLVMLLIIVSLLRTIVDYIIYGNS
jgi:hypothetical protein